MTTWWKTDGFEHGCVTTALYDIITATPAISTTIFRSGLRALQISTAAAAERVGYTLPASTRIVSIAFAIYLDDLPGANCQLASFTNANGNGQLRWNATSSRFVSSINNTNNTDFGPNPVATDTWYILLGEYDTSTGTASMRWRCYNATTGAQIGGTGTASRAQVAADNSSLSLGTQAAETLTAYYDDFAASITDGDFETWRVPWSIVSLIPTSDGTHNIASSGNLDSFTATAFSNATTTMNTFLGHRPLQLANTANQVVRQDAGGTTEYGEMLLEDLPAGSESVWAVRAYAAHVESAATGASLGEARLLLSDNTEVLTEGSISAINSTEDPGTTVTLRKRMCIDPSGRWDRDKVNGLKVRVGFADGDPDVNFIDFMVEVLLMPGITGAAALTGSGATSATGARERLGAAALSGAGSLVTAGSHIRLGAAALTGAGALVAAGMHEGRGAAALSGAGALAATGSHEGLGAAALAGTGALAATGAHEGRGAAALAGAGALAATGARERLGAAALSGAGALSATGARTRLGACALSGSGELVCQVVSTVEGAAALSGAGALVASGQRLAHGMAALIGTGALSATGQRTRTAAAALAGSGALAATGIAERKAAAALSGAGVLVTTGRLELFGAASLVGAGQLAVGYTFREMPSWPAHEGTDWPPHSSGGWEASADDGWPAHSDAGWPAHSTGEWEGG